QSQRF
ncbi:hypothetical protein D018_0659B, partial [Vibrio parahaemolyticus VP2007-007]